MLRATGGAALRLARHAGVGGGLHSFVEATTHLQKGCLVSSAPALGRPAHPRKRSWKRGDVRESKSNPKQFPERMKIVHVHMDLESVKRALGFR